MINQTLLTLTLINISRGIVSDEYINNTISDVFTVIDAYASYFAFIHICIILMILIVNVYMITDMLTMYDNTKFTSLSLLCDAIDKIIVYTVIGIITLALFIVSTTLYADICRISSHFVSELVIVLTSVFYVVLTIHLWSNIFKMTHILIRENTRLRMH